MMQGLIPGTTLFTEHVDFVYPTMLTFLLANIAMGICGMLLIRFFAKIVEVPGKCLTPIIAALCVIGSYAINNSFFDVIVMLVCSIVGYALPKFGFPTVPILIGFILGPVFETNFRNALIMSKGSYAIFFTRPICIFFLAFASICLISALYKNYQDTKRCAKARLSNSLRTTELNNAGSPVLFNIQHNTKHTTHNTTGGSGEPPVVLSL